MSAPAIVNKPFAKNGIRLCIDSRPINTALKRSEYPIPTSQADISLAFVFEKSEVQLLETIQHCMESLVMLLNIHSIDYDIVTNVINIWSVTSGRGDHILKVFSSSVNAKTKTLVPECALSQGATATDDSPHLDPIC